MGKLIKVKKFRMRTVEGYKDSLCEKLKLKARVGLVLYAIKTRS